MLGRKSSLKPLLSLLHSLHARVVDTTEFRQGQQARFGIAWSFQQQEREKREATLRRQREATPVTTTTTVTPAPVSTASDLPAVGKQKVKFFRRFSHDESVESIMQQLRTELTSHPAFECTITESAPYQWKISATKRNNQINQQTEAENASSSSSASSSPSPLVFACDLIVVHPSPLELMFDFQWRRPSPAIGSAVQVDHETSKRSFTAVAGQIQTRWAAKRTT